MRTVIEVNYTLLRAMGQNNSHCIFIFLIVKLTAAWIKMDIDLKIDNK